MKTLGSPHIRRPHERTLAVEAGQVVCPRRGVVDIEDCWVCPAYGGLSSSHIEGLICRAERWTERWTMPPGSLPFVEEPT
jgi:hypothetical protein